MGKKRQPSSDESDHDSGSESSSRDNDSRGGDDSSVEQPADENDTHLDRNEVDEIRKTNDPPSKTNDDENDDEIDDEDDDEAPKKKKKKVRRLKLAATRDFNAALKKRGVVYLSRIPPRMGPARVRTLLSDFGPVSRIYLVEEDKTQRKKRRKAGGSGGKRYTEGWAEFECKKAAKLVGESLNQSRVTNHKGSIHYDDFWNVKYLRGFKWSHLTEKVAYERRVREQKLRVEMMEARRENAAYVAQVEAGKRLDHIEERRKRRGGGGTKDGTGAGAEDGDAVMAKKRRKIRQKKPFEGDRNSTKSAILGSLV